MFVSSYNTYISTNTTDKSHKTKATPSTETQKSFTKLLDNPQVNSQEAKNIPIDYVNSSKVFSNKQKLQQNTDPKQEIISADKYNQFSSLKSSKVAYSDNSKMFSIVAKPKISISSQNLRGDDTSKQIAKQSAINTYLRNDRYYQITA